MAFEALQWASPAAIKKLKPDEPPFTDNQRGSRFTMTPGRFQLLASERRAAFVTAHKKRASAPGA
jgi:hypothetical protein